MGKTHLADACRGEQVPRMLGNPLRGGLAEIRSPGTGDEKKD